MRRIDLRPLFLGIATLAAGTPGLASEWRKEPPQVSTRVDGVLIEWQRRMAEIRSIDVTFHARRVLKGWGETKMSGRLILAKPDLGYYQVCKVDESETKTEARLYWTEESVIVYESDDPAQVCCYPSGKERMRLPMMARPPFLFGLTVDEAKDRYHWEILHEDRSWLTLSATLKPDRKPMLLSEVERTDVVLDKKTYLPRRVYFLDSRSREVATFEVDRLSVQVHRDNLEFLRKPNFDGFRIIRVSAFPKLSDFALVKLWNQLQDHRKRVERWMEDMARGEYRPLSSYPPEPGC